MNRAGIVLKPNWSITLHLWRDVDSNALRRPITLFNRDFPSLVVKHRTPHLHLHNLLYIPPKRENWFLETLFSRFDQANNRSMPFRDLRNEDIQIVKDPKKIVEYVLDINGWTDKEPEIVWLKAHILA